MFDNLIVLGIILVLAGALGIFALIGVINGHRFRKQTTTRSLVTRWLALLLAVAIIAPTVAQIYALTAKPADTTDDPPPAVQDEGEKFPAITLTDLELQQMFGGYSRVFDDSSMPIRAQERIAATKAAMLAAGYKEDQVFQDGVAFPILTDEQLKSLKDTKLSAEEKKAIFDQARKDLYQRIIANPVYGDMMVQGLCSISYITDSNPWLLEFRDKLNTSLNETTGKGWLTWLTPTNAQANEFTTSDEYFSGAARVCAVLEYFDFQQLTTKESAGNWSLEPAAEADYIRTQKSDYEESAEAIMLVHRQKSGDDKIQLGMNVFDGRLEIFDVTKPAPKPPTTPEPAKPQTTNYTLTIKYQYSDGTKAADTYTATKASGWKYSISSPAIPGWTPDKATVSGTLKKDTTITVTYTRNAPNQLKLTIYYKYSTGGTAADTYTASYNSGAWYEVNSPTIPGWKADQTVVYGTITKDTTVTVTYYENSHNLTIYYQYENGRQAASPYVKEGLVYGETFRKESPTIKGYEPDQAIVKGTMYDKDIEVYVTYYPSAGRLTIYYEYKDGSKAASTYQRDYAVGEYYSVTSPTIRGYTPTMSIVQGTMVKEGRTVTVIYTKDGNGVKDPAASSMNNGNADQNGGINNPNDQDTTGSYQPNNPPQHDYGTGGTTPPAGNNNGSGNNGNGTTSAEVPAGSTGDNQTIDNNPDQQQPPSHFTDGGDTSSDGTNTGTISKPT